MDEFYVKDAKGERGPFTFEELTDGRLEPDDMVRTGVSDWAKAGDLDDFAEYFRFEGYYFPTENNLAGFGIRLLAYFVDSFIIRLLTDLELRIFAKYLPADIQTFDMNNITNLLILQGIVFVAVIVYNFICYVTPLSATLGQSLFKLVIVDADGNKLTIWRALLRSFGKVLSFMFLFAGFFVIFFTEYKQGLHDLLAKTYVIRKNVL